MITAEVIARRAMRMLQAKANADRARGARRYFRETVEFFGLKSAEVTEMAAELFQAVKKEWTMRQAVELCEILLPDSRLEAKGVATLVFLKFKKEFGPDTFAVIKKWLLAGWCANWASVDTLCPKAMEAIFTRHPELAGQMKGWTESPNRWVKRAAAVSFIHLARRGRQLETAYDICRRLFPVEDDLIQKAGGWLLREAGKTDPDRLEKFLLKHGPHIPRTTLRYAIERFPEVKRKKLLTATKS